MTYIESVTLEVDDVESARHFYDTAFGLGPELRLRPASAPTAGFRGCTLSLVVAQPANADCYFDAAVAAGATVLKPAAKSFWGYGGVLQAPDGTIWKITTSAKKNAGPAVREYENMVLLLGVADVAVTRRFYVDRGFAVAKSFGRKYVEFATGAGSIGLALYGSRAAAKDAGVPVEGSGSHRLAVTADAGGFTDPDGFAWEPAPVHSERA